MKIIPSLLLLACLALSPISITPVQAQTDMEKSMDVINDSYRTLGRGLRNPTPADVPSLLGAVTVMREEAVKSREMTPMKIADMPEAEQAEAMEAYQKDMDTFIEHIDQMQAALEANDFDQAKEVFELLKLDRADGHEAWKN